MALVQSPAVLSQIRVARSFSEQAASLRAIRDEIIGHDRRKEWWVQNGILELLVKFLENNVQSPRLSGKERSGAGQSGPLGEGEVVRLLSLQLLASFAYAGAAFLGALHAAGVVPAIIPAISPDYNPPQVVLAALRVLHNITASARLAPTAADGTSGLSEVIFAPRTLDQLRCILYDERTDATVQEQKRLIARLISQLCKCAHHRKALADSGILDSLATMLASFVVARGEVVPRAEILAQSDGLTFEIPDPAPPGADLALVLEALSTIIANSRFCSCLLLCSPAIMAIFPSAEFVPLASESKAAWNALEMSGFGNTRARNPGAMDYLLPAIAVPTTRSQSGRFAEYPPLGVSLSRDNLASSTRSSTFKFTGWESSRFDGASGEDGDADEPESPLIPWLIHLIRSTDGLERVMAASLLTSLFKAGFATPEREQALAVLVVPLLCRMMRENDQEVRSSVQHAAIVEPEIARRWAIQEKVPEVLARLVGESETLQKAAHDCGIIKTVAKILKDSYESPPVQSPPRPWSPTPNRGTGTQDGPPTCRVGPAGQTPAYAHTIKMRENSLKLVAGMATLSNDYRQALVKEGVMAYVVEYLSPSLKKSINAKEKPTTERATEDGTGGATSPGSHNPNTVIIAACHVVRALGRSPSILRTTLQDHDVGVRINELARHPDAEVQIAALSAIINLVTNCSPMVEPLLEAGIVRTLCEHAHSLNPGLRLNALWALKHLVMDLDNTRRKQCLEELEPGWLVQLISDDTSEEEALHVQGRSERRATDAGDGEDISTAEARYEDDTHGSWTWPALSRIAQRTISPRLQQTSIKLSALRDAELNPQRKARNDSLAIQEQGLGFVRNLIALPNLSSQTDMVDYLFTELGQDRLFGILADKLKVRVVGAFSRRLSRGRDTLVLYPQARIVENLAYILAHIAAGLPRHRQLVVAQTELLKLLSAHMNSKDIGVRKALCQLFMNLSTVESDGERGPSAQRALELERLGFLAKLEGLEQGDADLDVRQRAKAAVAQMKTPTS
ncbi:armadillo-type protein [Chaetomium strumarium]|uniref:Armadillo-type protein n=1 Tax=Chaetomium strumarium TaxID=1170767 RepID=A0AAJ0GR11_9PEZI|nr:armadillo-type protein [Chaetomium strumarium]